jgi:drug/metabolite transporter (DMT)-like permease
MSKPHRIVLFTALAMLAFAGNSLLCRVALKSTSIDAASFTAIRIGAGALILLAILRLRRARPTAGGSWPMAAMLFAYAAFFSFAYRDLTAATGALLLFGSVQFSMLGWALIRGERLGGMQIAGLAIAVSGFIYLLLPGLAAPPPFAAALMIASGIAWAVYSVLGKQAGEPVASTGGNFVRAVAFAALIALAASTHASLDQMGVIYAVLSGAVTSGLGYVLWYAALPSLTTSSAGIIQLSVPAIATVGGALLLAEPIGARVLLASATILGGIALTILKKS